jgi:hypothetical protein
VARLTFLGDVFLPERYVSCVGGLEQYVLNMEYPITRSQRGYPGKINLCVRENYLEDTFGGVPAGVCLANNHILDYGLDGLEDTLGVLRREGVPYFGAGHNHESCNNPAHVECSGFNVALLGYACKSTSPVLASDDRPGVLPIELDQINQAMQRARKAGAQRIVVCLHWGAEEVYLPKPADVRIARALIDAGADLIIGHHAHRIQPWEKYGRKALIYGLGNCIFPDLKVESHFSETTGLPTRVVAKRMTYWNRRSLCVVYDPQSNAARIRKLHFDGRVLRPASQEFPAGDSELKFGKAYETKFRRSFFLGKTRAAYMSFLHNPRLPSLRHIRTLTSVANTRDYK